VVQLDLDSLGCCVNNLEGRTEVARVTEEGDCVGSILDLRDSDIDLAGAKVKVLGQDGAPERFRSDVEDNGSAVRDLLGWVGVVPGDGLNASNDPDGAFVWGVDFGNVDIIWAARQNSRRGLDTHYFCTDLSWTSNSLTVL